MCHIRFSTALALGACLSTSPTLAQSTRTQIDQGKAAKAAAEGWSLVGLERPVNRTQGPS
jgi:hypothetical protein